MLLCAPHLYEIPSNKFAGTRIGTYTCGGGDSVDIDQETSDLAAATAEAVLQAAGMCEGQLEGLDASVERAKANMTGTAETLVEGFASADLCEGCDAAVETLADRTLDALQGAVAIRADLVHCRILLCMPAY